MALYDPPPKKTVFSPQESAQRLGVTVGQARNLRRLAEYLWALPEDYQHFRMETFFSGDEATLVKSPEPRLCGAVACAIGHGIAAGVGMSPGVRERILHSCFPTREWLNYSDESFGCSPTLISASDSEVPLGEYLFGGRWSECDNSAKGAAQRILRVLSEGYDPSRHKISQEEKSSYQDYAP